MAAITFDYGSLQGPILETAKTTIEAFDYGWLNGAIVGKTVAAAPGGFSSAFFRENAGLGSIGGGPFARANAGLGAIA